MADDVVPVEPEAAAPEPAPAEEAAPERGAKLALDEFEPSAPLAGEAAGETDDDKSAADLAPVFDVPVHISAVLGRANLSVAQLLQLAQGSVLELDRKVGEAIDIYVNNRLVARGEVVIVDERLGVTMTEIIKDGDAAA
jgi:flagellar motor switch protein FliN/FliY